MAENKLLTIYFTSGESISFTFPPQAEDAYVASVVNNLLKEEKLVVEADGNAFVFPWSNIRYVQVTPPPSELPPLTIKGAQLLG